MLMNISSLLEGKTIISRVLSHGTLAQIRELFSAYHKEAINDVFRALKPGALSPRRRDYFTLILSS
jgi:hypothetical protein